MEPQLPRRPPNEVFADARAFAVEDRARTVRELVVTTLVFALCLGLTVPSWPTAIRVVGGGVEGLVLVRLFIFLHDIEHQAIFVGSRWGKVVSRVVGFMTLVSPSVWREFHDAHHASTAMLLDADLSQYRGGDRVNRVVDVDAFRGLSRTDRIKYGLVRHGAVFVFAWIAVFAIGIALGPFSRDPRRNADALFVLVVHFGLLAGTVHVAGWATAGFAFVLPLIIASTVGAYLFFAQHNFPTVVFQPRAVPWSAVDAALDGSSYFRMSAPMAWFTGNIGFHHVHHLHPRIPFYRLPDAMRAIPELHHPGETSFSPKDIAACLSLHVWDPTTSRLVGYDEAEAIAPRA